MKRRLSWVGVLLVVSGVVPGFVAGVVSGRTLFATSVNSGLVNAFSSVGQNLFGEAAFGASLYPPTPVAPNGGVQTDVSSATQVPVAMNVFIPGNPIIPGDPCKRFAQITIGPNGGTVAIDSTVAPANFSLEVVHQTIPGNPVVPAACPAQSPSF
jgi:hypothetical protein